MNQSESIDRLVEQFSKLPGVGKKSALRYAYSVIEMNDSDAEAFAFAVLDVKKKVHFCRLCGNYTDADLCEICSSRQSDVICVVAEPKDVAAIEKIHEYKGVYHVLHGLLSPLKGIGPDDIRIRDLLSRLDGVKEVIVATSPTAEGDATAMYIGRLVKPLGIKVTRIARGIPAGSEIEYSDEATLSHALSERKEI